MNHLDSNCMQFTNLFDHVKKPKYKGSGLTVNYFVAFYTQITPNDTLVSWLK